MGVPTIRDQFFGMYQEIKYKECFYTICRRHAQICITIYSAVMFSVSAVSTLLWSISKSMPNTWAIIIALAQLAQVSKDYLPWQQQLTATKFLNPALQKLLTDIETHWMRLDNEHYDDTYIIKLISKFNNAFVELEIQYAGDLYLPNGKRIIQRTQTECERYFSYKYPRN